MRFGLTKTSFFLWTFSFLQIVKWNRCTQSKIKRRSGASVLTATWAWVRPFGFGPKWSYSATLTLELLLLVNCVVTLLDVLPTRQSDQFHFTSDRSLTLTDIKSPCRHSAWSVDFISVLQCTEWHSKPDIVHTVVLRHSLVAGTCLTTEEAPLLQAHHGEWWHKAITLGCRRHQHTGAPQLVPLCFQSCAAERWCRTPEISGPTWRSSEAAATLCVCARVSQHLGLVDAKVPSVRSTCARFP